MKCLRLNAFGASRFSLNLIAASLLLGQTVVSGCSSNSKTVASGTTGLQDSGAPKDSGELLPELGEYGACTSSEPWDPPPDLTGRWAVRTIASRRVGATMLTAEFYMRTISVLLCDQTQSGTDVRFSAKFCRQYAEDQGAVAHVTVPDSYVNSLKPFERVGTYGAGDAGAGINVLWLPLFPQVVGATLADPLNDELPTAVDDPAVFDQDGDGNPGITIKLSGIVSSDLYVVQRQKDELTGIALSNDRVVGHFSFTSEQNVLASNPKLPLSLASQTATTDSRPCASTFTMIRVASTSTCADVLADVGLFE